MEDHLAPPGRGVTDQVDQAFKSAKQLERAFGASLKERGAAALVPGSDLHLALAAARDGWATYLLSDPVAALARDAQLRLWSLQHAPIDELQRELRRQPRPASSQLLDLLLQRFSCRTICLQLC